MVYRDPNCEDCRYVESTEKAFSGLTYNPSMPAHGCRIIGRTQCKEGPITRIERHYSMCFQMAADNKYLKSKTEAPFVWMNCSVEDFCKRQPEDFKESAGYFRGLSTPEKSQVYYVGDQTVYVLLLCVIEDPDIKGKYSLVGLKTLMEKD